MDATSASGTEWPFLFMLYSMYAKPLRAGEEAGAHLSRLYISVYNFDLFS